MELLVPAGGSQRLQVGNPGRARTNTHTRTHTSYSVRSLIKYIGFELRGEKPNRLKAAADFLLNEHVTAAVIIGPRHMKVMHQSRLISIIPDTCGRPLMMIFDSAAGKPVLIPAVRR